MNALAGHERERANVVTLRPRSYRMPETGFDVMATRSLLADRMRDGGLDVEKVFSGGLVASEPGR